MPVKKGGTIGVLHHEIAELTVAKAKLQADSTAPIEKAAGTEGRRRFGRGPQLTAQRAEAGMVSAEDVAKAEGELKVAVARSTKPRRTGRSPRPS